MTRSLHCSAASWRLPQHRFPTLRINRTNRSPQHQGTHAGELAPAAPLK